MMHTEHGDYRPQEMNFAFSGTLVINGISFPVALGQGHYSSTNNWFLNSDNLDADDDHKGGKLIGGGAKYKLEPDGSYTFKVSKV